LVKVALVALALCTVVISMEGNFTAHVGEYLALICWPRLDDVPGQFDDLLMIFISARMNEPIAYILTAFNKRNITPRGGIEVFSSAEFRGVHIVWPEPRLRLSARPA